MIRSGQKAVKVLAVPRGTPAVRAAQRGRFRTKVRDEGFGTKVQDEGSTPGSEITLVLNPRV
jgi:hypothetical protein